MEDEILKSWNRNAEEWDRTIRNETITSRKVTNEAIVSVLSRYRPSKLVDIGCGEGWLVRTMNSLGITTEGIDGTQALIAMARTKGGEFYSTYTFEQIGQNPALLKENGYGSAVLNFCLYEKELVGFLTGVAGLLHEEKRIFIQTLHPGAFFKENDAKGKWQTDSWKGLSGKFQQPHRWYARTMEEWKDTFAQSGLSVAEIIEPGIDSPMSIIFVLEAN